MESIDVNLGKNMTPGIHEIHHSWERNDSKAHKKRTLNGRQVTYEQYGEILQCEGDKGLARHYDPLTILSLICNI